MLNAALLVAGAFALRGEATSEPPTGQQIGFGTMEFVHGGETNGTSYQLNIFPLVESQSFRCFGQRDVLGGETTRCEDQMLARASLTRRLGLFSLSIGQERLHQGGYGVKDWTVRSVFLPRYAATVRPLPWHRPVVEVATVVGGWQLSMQATNDVTTKFPESGEFNGKAQDPALLFEATAASTCLQPLIQAGNYDRQHSAFGVFGLKVHCGLDLTVEAVLDRRARKFGARAADEWIRAVSLRVATPVTLHQIFRPFAQVSYLEVKQPNVEVIGLSDRKSNTDGRPPDDNETRIEAGTEWFSSSAQQLVPYALMGVAIRRDQTEAGELTRRVRNFAVGVTLLSAL